MEDEHIEIATDPSYPKGYYEKRCYYTYNKKACKKEDAFYCHIFVYDENNNCVKDYLTRYRKP